MLSCLFIEEFSPVNNCLGFGAAHSIVPEIKSLIVLCDSLYVK